MDIKNIIIFLVVFFLVLWLQHNDDKKFGNTEKRISLYDKVKIPLVSALFVILIKDMDINKCTSFVHSILLVKPSNVTSPDVSIPMPIDNKVLNDIFIGPPDF
jgi:hypothetical protein